MAEPPPAVPARLLGSLDAQQHGDFDEYLSAIMLFADAQVATQQQKRAVQSRQLLQAVQNKFLKMYGRAHTIWKGLVGSEEITREAAAADKGTFPSP